MFPAHGVPVGTATSVLEVDVDAVVVDDFTVECDVTLAVVLAVVDVVFVVGFPGVGFPGVGFPGVAFVGVAFVGVVLGVGFGIGVGVGFDVVFPLFGFNAFSMLPQMVETSYGSLSKIDLI